MKLSEAVDLQIFSRIVSAFHEYVSAAPGSGNSRWLNKLLKTGLPAVPKDERAQRILDFVLSSRSSAFAINQLLNLRLCDLPVGYRPCYQDVEQGRLQTAGWKQGDQVYDRVCNLVNWDGVAGGSWVDSEGQLVKLVDETPTAAPAQMALGHGTVQVAEALTASDWREIYQAVTVQGLLEKNNAREQQLQRISKLIAANLPV